MAHVRGIGGIFFKSDNPEALYAWYQENLGISGKPGEGAMFQWRQPDDATREDLTVWSIFPRSTKYFKTSRADFMLNYIVDDLDAVLAHLKANGVQVEEPAEPSEYGKFGWATDPDGNRFELWEPPKGEAKP